MRNRWWAAPVAAAAVALLATACGSTSSPAGSSSGSGASSSAPASTSTAGTTSNSSSASGITTASTSKGTVLVNSKGRTLYWFAIDTPTTSKCNGTCAGYWPPVLGKPSMAAGAKLTGKFGTIKRANGQIQATYDGHPLYTFASDTAAGMVNGNGVNTSGGLWWAMTPSAAKLSAAKPKASSSKSSGGGGYGY
jgi:predicted lipoprotein with Yx(FWY)xxD motif